ncbi:MAG: 16S rRNA (guanine(527)-N(7))-methyltransferase RsmG [Desulfobulbaceae bacterium]|nr:16S rRNA (guanine(527)-N(7))-methyltransferase RsmG [Desulfobulbaceae bacterium]
MIREEEAGRYLNSGLLSLGLEPLSAPCLARFWLYFLELEKWNRKMNLVAKATEKDILETHFLDSLTLLPELIDGPLLDVGSGAGFPGLALKIAKPELSVVLLEPRQKRVNFLRHVIRSLHLQDIEVVPDRLTADDQAFISTYGQFPLITSRALAEIDPFLALVAAVSPPAGRVLCMKGPRCEEELAAWRQQSPCSPFVMERGVHFALPFSGAGRSVVIFRKKEEP